MLETAVSTPTPAPRNWRTWPDSVVERAIRICGGFPVDLQHRLSQHLRREVSKQTVHGWRLRGVFPKDLIFAVNEVTGISVEELLLAKPVHRAKPSSVVRAIAKGGGSASKFAAELSRSSGREVTRQMVNNWLAAGQFPRTYVLDIHLLTKLPIAELMEKAER